MIADGFLLFATVLELSFGGFDPVFDSRDESALPNVAAVWLEYPESLNSSRMALLIVRSGLDRLTVLAACLVSGRAVSSSSS